MKIIIISTPLFRFGPQGLSGYGGLEQIAWEQARCLAKLGHQVALICPDGSTCPGVQCIPNTLPDHQGRMDEKQAYSGVKGTPYGGYWQHLVSADVIIDNSWQKYSMMLRLEGNLKAPVLGVLHAPADKSFSRPDVPLPPPKAIAYVCISEDQALHFRQLFGRDCRTAYNGVDTEFYKPLGVPRSDRFLFLGRFSPEKGPDIAIEACKKAGVGLDLIGDTSIIANPEFAQKCLSMADGDQIRFVGHQPRGACPWWFSQAHCMIHANLRFREPFGLAPVEAQLCGCPVLCFDFGAMRETLKHPDTGFLVKTEEELTEQIKNVSRLGAMYPEHRNNCREWASRFSVEAMARRYAELCTEAIDLKGGW